MNILTVFLYFWIMSIIGWIIEVLAFIIIDKKLVNRGFLIGPYCPIYGCGGLILLCLMPFKDNLLLTFFLALLLCTILEYITSYLMELIFKVRWWDYSDDFLNINGRVCLRNALAFGFLGLIAICFVNPYLFNLIDQIPHNTLIVIDIVILLITLSDLIMSFNIMNNIKNTISKINTKFDATEDIKKTIKDSLLKKNFLYRRIVNAYNRFEYYYGELKNKLSSYRKKELELLRLNNGKRLLLFLLIGNVCAIILGYFINSYKKSFIICISITLLISLIYDRIKNR